MAQLNYITAVPRDYKPHIYTYNLLSKFLHEKHIINRSSYTPTPEEIEILALDLNFIYDQKLGEEELQACLNTYKDKINRFVFFKEQLPRSSAKGHIGHLFKTPWSAPPQDWLSRILSVPEHNTSQAQPPEQLKASWICRTRRPSQRVGLSAESTSW